jgi:hypothetical protein
MRVDLDGLARNIKAAIGGPRRDEWRFMVDEIIRELRKPVHVGCGGRIENEPGDGPPRCGKCGAVANPADGLRPED